MIIGNKNFEGHTYIMGILNVTPDSFSDGGKFNSIDAALKHTEQMIAEGADIIDIGGESTRPGYVHITPEEEIQRVCPVIEKIKANFDVPISIDTYHYRTAEAAVKSGAHLINDIWGFRYDNGEMAAVAAKYGVQVCLMHNRKVAEYNDYLNNVVSDLAESISIAEKAGVDRKNILTDPGIGFAKSFEQNLELTNHLEVLDKLGLPILLGTSRKSMIGLALDLPSDQRVEGTLVTTVIAVQKNCLFVRVHDIKENKRAITMTEKIMGKI
ncbi:MAG: dihydropteroate synthase [Oscillospiraceae bacterium]|nr:dihydropteroate synthase [Oscillospiraceae bacterium]